MRSSRCLCETRTEMIWVSERRKCTSPIPSSEREAVVYICLFDLIRFRLVWFDVACFSCFAEFHRYRWPCLRATSHPSAPSHGRRTLLVTSAQREYTVGVWCNLAVRRMGSMRTVSAYRGGRRGSDYRRFARSVHVSVSPLQVLQTGRSSFSMLMPNSSFAGAGTGGDFGGVYLWCVLCVRGLCCRRLPLCTIVFLFVAVLAPYRVALSRPELFHACRRLGWEIFLEFHVLYRVFGQRLIC